MKIWYIRYKIWFEIFDKYVRCGMHGIICVVWSSGKFMCAEVGIS